MICVKYTHKRENDTTIVLCEKIDEYEGHSGTLVTLRNYIEIKGIPEPHEAELVWDLVQPGCGLAGISKEDIEIIDLYEPVLDSREERLKKELLEVNADINNYFEGDNDEHFTEEYYQTLKNKQTSILRELGLDRICANCKWTHAKFEYKCEECVELSKFEYDNE